jgi:SAM-dependent methyltransferase
MTPDQSPEAALATVYDEGAAAYDRHWAPVLHHHSLALLDPLPTGTGLQAIEVGGGVGTLASALAVRTGTDGLVVAIDRSQGMLRRAPQSLPRVQADAVRLPIAGVCADVVVFAFVLFLLPDARSAVAEAARVLRQRGWLLAATWGAQLDTGADVVVREELDRAGAPNFPPLPRSDELTNTAGRILNLLGPAGFTDVRTQRRPLDATFDQDSALSMRTGCGSLGWRYARLDPDARDKVRRSAAERLAELPAESFVDRSEVLLTWARRS